MKKRLLIILFFLSSLNLFSQIQKNFDYVYNYERILEDAQIAYEENDYGKALNLAEKSKQSKKNHSEYEISVLENSLKSSDVKKKGDSIENILEVLLEREDYDAINIIKRNLKKYGESFFNNSKQQLLTFIKRNSVFPEADFLIGKIYCLEGEYELSYNCLLTSYKNAEFLDIYDERYDILYELANISKILKKNDKYEEYLLLILTQSFEFKDNSFCASIKKTVESSKTDCMEKFFSHYRCTNYNLLNAYFDLTEYYQEQRQYEKALKTCEFGVITAYTKFVNVLKKRNPEFEISSISDVFKEVQNYSDIIEWGKENNIWKGFYTLADLSYINNNLIFSMQLFNILKDYEPEVYWKNKAEIRLSEIIPK